ncbi:Histone-lysine N-methyltransferase MLL5 [Eufriesea mexicana]|uniref:Histone-lysine N-methyltransferase MLL5 n=1 Tax=Eufriesea mexicana TaxID=516756 RepID=A0A310SRF2_9HYME|nr:Histone-lysine N-methyltransferase MLL5 [Eufriesea mexicana]
MFQNTIELLKQIGAKSIECGREQSRGLNAGIRNLVWWGTPLVVVFAGYEVKSYRPQGKYGHLVNSDGKSSAPVRSATISQDLRRKEPMHFFGMTSECINGACGYYGWRDRKASKTSTPSVIKLSGGGTGGGGEQLSPGSGPPPPVSPAEHTDANENDAIKTKRVDNFPQSAETTMSFVLQLGTVETSLEKKNSSSQPSSSLNQETSNAVVAGSDDAGKPQILQCLENTSEIPTGHVISFSTVKSVSVTYPVAKAVREVQRIAGSQTNTTQVLSTRVISQKLPSSSHQTQSAPLTLNASSNVTHVPVNAQSLPSPGSGVAHVYPLQHSVPTQNKQQTRNQVVTCEGKPQQQTTTISSLQSSMPLKVQPVPSQLVVGNSAVRAIATATSLPNIQRIHVKAQNLVGQTQTVNLQKVKGVANVSQGVTVQRNSVPRIQTVQKSQVSTGTAQTTQFAVNQVTNNANVQRAQQGNSTLQKAQANAASTQKVAQVYNNQKVPSQMLSNHPNHKAQLQQITSNQQQGLQKLQVQSQKTVTTVPRQQSNSAVNNIQKPSNSVAGIQKVQVVGQVQCQQQLPQVQKHVQQVQPSQHQRSQSTAALQKSQTVATVNTSRVQSIANVCKSNSVPNISKTPQNANLLAVNKQPVISQPQQSQQVHTQNSSQLQQQLLQQTSQAQQSQQQTVQKQHPQQQQANANPQTQRSHSITNVHQKVATIATIPNNQRTQVLNSKMQQQQMVMRVGVPKNQAQNLQQNNLKNVSQKIANTVKTSNSQNVVQQSLHRNTNAQPVKIIQQQQNVIGPQNAQKQPGCIKTIPPQKPAQRNHTQKVAGIKTSLNTNVAAVKSQGPTTAVAQKASIKTLLPQQTVATNMLMHKNQPIKIQQTMQQKQIITTSQFPPQIRQQSGQVKTLLPVTSMEPRKDVENKTESETREPKEDERQQRPTTPVIRIPPPYECLQYVLQDHNYGAPPPRTPSPPSPPSHLKQPINGAGSSTATSQHTYIYGKVVSSTNVDDDAASAISSETGRDVELEGEETETAPEGEGDDEDSVTRCICEFEHDDGYMICCDRCLVWQHVDCMGIDRSNIPDEYLCEICRPRRVDRQRARALQMRKREELLNSDTSSDTSSTSSADTDVGMNTIPKKRTLQQQIPRRKSEPPQVRRLNNNNNNNNNNVAKRQRRDSHPRQSSAVRKKEVTKRGPGKRKAKRRMSLEDKEEETQDTWSSNVAPLRQWIERYEEAVTNHYSPELRARISSIKVNGTHSDLRQSNMNVIATGKCRLNVHSNNVRFLVATMYLPPNTPVVELRGKYMLSTQHRPSYPQGRQHTQRPGPFVFFYRLPRDGTEVCVDTRTYGNDARFVRRSCKPNAEVKHCIEKGTLHLYIVTTTAIEKNAEITIRHEQHDLLLSPNPNGPMMPIVCACNNPRECQIVSLNQLNRRGSNGALAENADGRERRRRGRRNTICEDSDSSIVMPNNTIITQPTPPPTTVSSVSAPPRRTVTTTIANTGNHSVRQAPKEEPPTLVQQPQTSPNLNQTIPSESKKDKKKMTREERKMEAIMKAFERLEKAEQRKQEVQARNAQRKESGGTHSDNEDSHSVTMQSKQKQQNSDRPLRRKRRKGRARTTSTSQSQGSSRRTRLNSADSDESSGEESTSMQSPPLLSQNHSQNRDAPYSSHLHTPAKNANETVAIAAHQGIPTAAGLLLALANSNAPGPSSPPLQQPTPVKSPTCDSAPPKKRRIARESLSSDNYTPPTTPTMLVPESTANNRSLCPAEDDFIEQLQSPLVEQNDERHITTETVKQEVTSHEHVNSDAVVRQKLSIDIPPDFHVKTVKSEKHIAVTQMDTSLVKEENVEIKKEDDEMNCDTYMHLESKSFIKDELRLVKNEIVDHFRDKSKKEHIIKKEENLETEKGTVEIVDQNEADTEMEDFSSPIAVMESDAILKQRVAEMRLEFGGSISEMVKVEDDKCDDDKQSEDVKCEVKSDDNMSIDEFDVEAQMKKITGDDGNDYKEKVDTSSEKDKSMDGIEGLMESSKEDSESEDKEMDDVKYEPSFKTFNLNHEEKLFKEFESKAESECTIENSIKEIEQSQESQKIEQPSAFITSSEESIFESASSNMDTESIVEPPKIFHSIPPLSERIRKKTEATSAPKSQLNFEAAIIESSINMETDDESKNGEQKSMLSTALRELLEAKLDDLTPDDAKEEIVEENNAPYIELKSEILEQNIEIQESVLKPTPQNVNDEEVPVKEEESPPKEVKRLKDPRTVVPNTMPAPAFKPEGIPPVKRKLSISEYRKRKQQSSGTPPEPEPSSDTSTTDKGGARGRSDSASSGTSSLSSDEEGSKISLSLDIPTLTALPLFISAEGEEKKGGEEGTIGWSAAPTLVERQRENLTERLKREFGLFLSDDEEERARKHGLTAEAILKARKSSPPHPTVSNTPPGYPLPQLPPQPYIPPPGSASIHYPQFQAKPCPVQYPNFTVPQNTSQPVYANAAPQTSTNKQAQQFLVPQASQAPPGSNPYPPQFIPPSTTAVSISKYTSVTPPSGNQIYPASGQTQKQFYNHPAPRS